MNTKGGKNMNTMTVAGLSLALIGIFVIIWGASLEPVNLMSPNFMSFVTGGLILVAIGLCMISGLSSVFQVAGIWLAAIATMFYIYSLPDTDLIIKFIGFVPVLAFAIWLSNKFWE